jgi:hypothetical protein
MDNDNDNTHLWHLRDAATGLLLDLKTEHPVILRLSYTHPSISKPKLHEPGGLQHGVRCGQLKSEYV